MQIDRFKIERRPADPREVQQGIKEHIHPHRQPHQPLETFATVAIHGRGPFQQLIRVIGDAAQRLLQVMAGYIGGRVELLIAAREFRVEFAKLLRNKVLASGRDCEESQQKARVIMPSIGLIPRGTP